MALDSRAGVLAGEIEDRVASQDVEGTFEAAAEAAALLKDVATVVEEVAAHYANYPARLRLAGGSDYFDEDEEACTAFYTQEAALNEQLLDKLMRRLG